MNAKEKIIAAAQYLGAELPQNKTLTISADVLRKLSRGRAVVRPFNGGQYVAGIAGDGRFLPQPSDAPRKAELTIVAPNTDDELAALLAALTRAVRDRPPAGSQYDPAMKARYDEWRSLLVTIQEMED